MQVQEHCGNKVNTKKGVYGTHARRTYCAKSWVCPHDKLTEVHNFVLNTREKRLKQPYYISRYLEQEHSTNRYSYDMIQMIYYRIPHDTGWYHMIQTPGIMTQITASHKQTVPTIHLNTCIERDALMVIADTANDTNETPQDTTWYRMIPHDTNCRHHDTSDCINYKRCTAMHTQLTAQRHTYKCTNKDRARRSRSQYSCEYHGTLQDTTWYWMIPHDQVAGIMIHESVLTNINIQIMYEQYVKVQMHKYK